MKELFIFLFLLVSSPAFAEVKVLAFAGSTRNESYNKKIIQEAARIAREMKATVKVIDLKDFPMPHFDEDLEKAEWMPVNAKRFRALLIESDAIIISTPEYNGSIPGVLKNALDWASRSEEGKGSREAFKEKHFAIISASPGGGGGVRALIHLRAILNALGADVIPLQVSVSSVDGVFDEQGHIKNGSIRTELREEIQQLINRSQPAQTTKIN
jgi:NAD(P)H-dependent FMN reductase